MHVWLIYALKSSCGANPKPLPKEVLLAGIITSESSFFDFVYFEEMLF